MSDNAGGIVGAQSAMRFSPMRGRMGGSGDFGLQYPSPFFDIAHTYMPATVKMMFRWCRYYFLVNPLINAVVFKMSEYPVTDIIFDTERSELKRLWEEFLLDHLRYRAFQIEVGLDYHCLAGSTLVSTKDGVFPIRELAGREVEVLSEGGVYRKATFRSYGMQELWEVHTDDGVFYATAEHEWPVFDHNTKTVVRRKTRELRGKRLVRTVAPRPPQNDEFWSGVRHGVIFGDGTLSNEGRQAHVCLYSQEKRTLARYFETYTVTPHKEDHHLGVYGLPPAYKKLPASTESASYWYGFTCGLLATDGCVDNRGQAMLTQKDRSVLLKVREQLSRFGMVGGRVREHWAWNSYTKQREPMNYLSLKTQYLVPQDFVRPDQRGGFEEHLKPTSYGRHLGVKKVAATSRVEEVFCCVEPETHSFVIENSVLTGNCYGNCIVSIFYPFVKMLECPECHVKVQAKDMEYRFQNYQFIGTCKKCDHHGPFKVHDHYIKAPKGIRLLRWNPEDVDIRYNEITGEYEYYYEIPTTLKNDIIIGKKSTVETVPQLFIEAMKQKKAVVFSRDNVYHFKRPTLAGKDRGWGTPMILPVLKDTFYLQVMRKAQEAIMLQHIVPLHVLFPQAGSASSDPYTSINLSSWRDQVASELRRWRSDANYIPILPLPIGHQTIGGDGRALLLTQEIRVWSEQIVAGMGIPVELIFGGLSYSGSNVSLRMLENAFLGYLQDHVSLLKWVIKRTSAYLGWAPVRARFKPFKMADDLQRKAYLFQLKQAGEISSESLLADADFDAEKEDKIIERESTRRAAAQKKQRLLQAEIEGEAGMISMKWQSKVQSQQMKEQMVVQNEMMKDQAAFQGQMQQGLMQGQMAAQQGGEVPPTPPEMQSLPRQPELLEPPSPVRSPLTLQSVQPIPPGANGESLAGKTNVDLLLMGRQVADKIMTLGPTERPMALSTIKSRSPDLHDIVLGLMMSGGNGPTQAGSAAARPLPEQNPPRRGPDASLV